MLYSLEKQQAQRAALLFEGEHLALVIDAVAAGNSPGVFWLDDLQAPRTALMWDLGHCVYITGEADSDEVVATIRQQVAEGILPAARRWGIGAFKLYTSGPEWDARVAQIFPNIDLARLERSFYILGQPNVGGWRERVPPGYRIAPIDEQILEADFKNAGDVQEEIESGWNSLDDFFGRGFGYCAIHKGETEGGESVIAGWCTAEYVSERKCGIGIETVDAYINRGLATAMASAFVEHCLEQGIAPHWDSWKQNLPSVRVAEKVGFRLAESYSVYFGRLPEE